MEKQLAERNRIASSEERRKRRQVQRIRKVRKIKRILAVGACLAAALIGISVWMINRREALPAFHQEEGLTLETTEAAAEALASIQQKQEFLGTIEGLVSKDSRYQEILDMQEELPDVLLKIAIQNEETLDFVLDYPFNKDKAPADTIGEVSKGEVPLLLQWDERWGYAPYGSGSMVAVSGCGPTCIAMVAASLTGRNDITPAKVASYSEANGFLTASRDTSWDLMTYGGQEYGIIGTELGLDEAAMIEKLNMGFPIILSVSPGDFTSGGHFIVIRGYEDGAFLVNDPNSRERSEKTWSFERLRGQVKNMWYYTLV